MTALVTLIADTAALIATVGLIQLVVLAFRNPFRPSWLKRNGVDNFAAVAIPVGLSLSVGFEITGLFAIGLPPIVAIFAAPAVAAGIGYAIWRLFDCRERLRRADAGQSPFYRSGSQSSLPAAPVGA